MLGCKAQRQPCHSHPQPLLRWHLTARAKRGVEQCNTATEFIHAANGSCDGKGQPAKPAPAAANQPLHHSPSRRAFNVGAATAAAALLVPPPAALASRDAAAAPPAPAAGAGRVREMKMVMRVTALRGSVPQQWVADFGAALEDYGLVAMTLRPQVADIWSDLSGGKGGKRGKLAAPTTADAVTLGDAWLQPAIARGLIQPIPDAEEYRWWDGLSPRWRQLVTRNAGGLPDAEGQVWAAPYRWGCTLVLYRTDTARRWGGPIVDWDDLLRPELKGRIAFMDSPRELVAVALKTLGLPISAGSDELAACGVSEGAVAARVAALAGQVRVFSNVDHVRAMWAGEVDVLVGWSDDLLPLAERQSNLAVVAPLSGTALWADLWCVPSAEDGEPSPLLPAWLELALQPVRAQRSRGLRRGASPLLLPPAAGDRGACLPVRAALSGSAELAGGVMPSEEVLQRSDFLLPLSPSSAAMYRRLLKL